MKIGRGKQLEHGRHQLKQGVKGGRGKHQHQERDITRGKRAELNRGWMVWGVRRVNTRGMDEWSLPHSHVISCRPVEDREPGACECLQGQ